MTNSNERVELKTMRDMSRAMQRLRASEEWSLFVKYFRERKSEIEPLLRQILGDEDTVRRLSFAQGQLSMLDEFLEYPDDCVTDAAEEVAAFQRKEEQEHGRAD